MVLNNEEKIGGLPVYINKLKTLDFSLIHQAYSRWTLKVVLFTQWNGKYSKDYIFEKLDRTVVNQDMFNLFEHVKVENLIRIGLDHAPLFLSTGKKSQSIKILLDFLAFGYSTQIF